MQWLLTTAFNLLIHKRTLAGPDKASDGRIAPDDASSNLSRILDDLLTNYDPKFRPGFETGKPTRVVINMNVRSMGPISEQDMTYSMDCYFRQSWQDPRLTFVGQEKTLSLGISMLDKIWKPDTYFWNGAKSYLHKLTTPNKFVRLSQDGSVYFSSRLTVKAKCPMYLQRFPLDVQNCPLVLGSFAYQATEIGYVWQVNPVSSSELYMSQFELKTIVVHNASQRTRDVDYSTLTVDFILERHMGYFLINFYAPCTLIVILSWVAFWLNREATADRIALGATSILTMTFIALDSRSDLPRVTYPTALDVYILICYGFLLTCIVEFAVVHSYTKFNTGDPEMRMFEAERIRALGMGPALADVALRRRPSIQYTHTPFPISPDRRDQLASERLASELRKRSSTALSSPGANGDVERRSSVVSCVAGLYDGWVDAGRKLDPFDTDINSTSTHFPIDRVARIVFPLSFALISCAYWFTYIRRHDEYALDIS